MQINGPTIAWVRRCFQAGTRYVSILGPHYLKRRQRKTRLPQPVQPMPDLFFAPTFAILH